MSLKPAVREENTGKELSLPWSCAQYRVLVWLLLVSAMYRGPGMSWKRPEHLPHPWKTATCCHSCSKVKVRDGQN